MSHYKQYDQGYQNKRAKDPNYDDPYWCAFEELEKRIQVIEKLVLKNLCVSCVDSKP